jgi:23S rRNA (cytidine1920-2'-O)/16S rRNA (cytidine1409-2'-O)-methyltransferase
MERTNVMHVKLPEKVELITIDTAWTKQILTISNALENLKLDGSIISLIKPHYEAPKEYLERGRLKDEFVDEVLESVKNDIVAVGGKIVEIIESPIVGEKGKNREFLALVKKAN